MFLAPTYCCALLLILAHCESSQDCKNFWQRWKRKECHSEYDCLSIQTSDGTEQQWQSKGKLQCNGESPDTELFKCASSSDLNTLTMVNCQLYHFDMKSFLHNEKPTFIGFTNFNGKLADVNITNMPFLKSFTIKNVQSAVYFPFRFLGETSLSTLYVYKYGFTNFPDKPFQNLSQLSNLNIELGTLQQLKEEYFSGLTSLKKLSLFSNSIKSIHPSTFSKVIKVTSLDLSRNRITVIQDFTFDWLINLEMLDLSHNPLLQLPLIRPFGPSRNLSVVRVSNCNLIELPNIEWQDYNFTYLDFSENKITEVHLPVYSRSRVIVRLVANKIKTIDLDFEKHHHYNVSPFYSIDHNPLECNCKLKTFLEFVNSEHKKSHQLFGNIDDITCNHANRKRRLVEMSRRQMSCPKEKCPKNCVCFEVWKNAMLVNCSSRWLTQLPLVPARAKFVYLQNNKISTLTNNHKSWNKVTHIYLTNNSLKTLDNWNAPPKLKLLAVSNNHLDTLPIQLITLINFTDFKISLLNNEWKCDCESREFINWIKANQKNILDYSNMTCQKGTEGNEEPVQFLIREVTIEEMCDDNSNNTNITMKLGNTTVSSRHHLKICLLGTFTFIPLLLLIFLLYLFRQSCLALLYSHRLIPVLNFTESKEQKSFDAYLCFDDSDTRYANAISERLEPEYKLFLHDRDWIGVESPREKILGSIENSRFVVLLLSYKFINSTWFLEEFRRLYHQMPKKCRSMTIPIFLKDIQSITYLPKDFYWMWYIPRRLKWNERFFWQKLLYFLHPVDRNSKD